MSDNFTTWSDLQEILKQIRGRFCSIASRRLSPGAKINGVLFDGSHDIQVPVSLSDHVFLSSGQVLFISFEDRPAGASNDIPGFVLSNTGLYFSPGDGGDLVPLITATKNQDGTFTIEGMNGETVTASPAGTESTPSNNEPTASTTNVTPTANTTSNPIGFRV